MGTPPSVDVSFLTSWSPPSAVGNRRITAAVWCLWLRYISFQVLHTHLCVHCSSQSHAAFPEFYLSAPLQAFCSYSRSDINVHRYSWLTSPVSLSITIATKSVISGLLNRKGSVWAKGLNSCVYFSFFLAKCAKKVWTFSGFVDILSCSLCICVTFYLFIYFSLCQMKLNLCSVRLWFWSSLMEVLQTYTWL